MYYDVLVCSVVAKSQGIHCPFIVNTINGHTYFGGAWCLKKKKMGWAGFFAKEKTLPVSL